MNLVTNFVTFYTHPNNEPVCVNPAQVTHVKQYNDYMTKTRMFLSDNKELIVRGSVPNVIGLLGATLDIR